VRWRRRFGHANGGGHGGVGRADVDAERLTDQRAIRRRFTVDVGCDERDQLYRLGWLDRHESDIGDTKHRCVDGRRELHADVYGCRWFDRADSRRYGRPGSSTDADVVGFANERSIGFGVAIDLGRNERDELYGIG